MKIVLNLTMREMMRLSWVFSDAQRNHEDWLKIKNKSFREAFEREEKRRHKLWLKITHQMEAQKWKR
jgi:hypothetical protein